LLVKEEIKNGIINKNDIVINAIDKKCIATKNFTNISDNSSCNKLGINRI